jgi:hypothetical protein
MKDKDQDKLWEAYLNEGIPRHPNARGPNDPFGSSEDEHEWDEPHPDAQPSITPDEDALPSITPDEDEWIEMQALRAQGIPVTRKDPETGLWRYKPENDAEWEAAKAHQAAINDRYPGGGGNPADSAPFGPDFPPPPPPSDYVS